MMWPGWSHTVMLCRLSPSPALFFISLVDKNNYALELVKKYTLCMEHWHRDYSSELLLPSITWIQTYFGPFFNRAYVKVKMFSVLILRLSGLNCRLGTYSSSFKCGNMNKLLLSNHVDTATCNIINTTYTYVFYHRKFPRVTRMFV